MAVDFNFGYKMEMEKFLLEQSQKSAYAVYLYRQIMLTLESNDTYTGTSSFNFKPLSYRFWLLFSGQPKLVNFFFEFYECMRNKKMRGY